MRVSGVKLCGCFRNDDPQDDVDPEREPAEEYQNRRCEADKSAVEPEIVGQSAAYACQNAVAGAVKSLVRFHRILVFFVGRDAGVFFRDDYPQEDINPERQPAEQKQQQRDNADQRRVRPEEPGQSAADTRYRAVRHRAAQRPQDFMGRRISGACVCGAVAEVRRPPHPFYRFVHGFQRDYLHRGGDAFAEDFRKVAFDVVQRLRVVFRQAVAHGV